MAAISQTGETLKIGLTGSTYTAHIVEDADTGATGVQDVILDEDAATTTILISDLGTSKSITALIKDAGSLTPPAQGSLVTLGATKYRVVTSSVRQSRKVSVLSMDVIREDSMAAVYDA